MSSRAYKNILLTGFGAVMIFAPLARAAVNIWSAALLEAIILLLLFVWLWWKNDDGPVFRKTKLDLPICLFLGLSVISAIFGIYKYASIYELLRLLTMIAVFYLVVNNFDKEMVLKSSIILIVMGSAMSLLGLAQYFWGLDHSWWKPENMLAATYVNHNHFAGYLELVIPLTIGLAIGVKKTRLTRFKERTLRSVLILALITMIGALIFSQSRGAWVSLILSLAVMNIVLVKRRVLRKESLIAFLLLLSLATVYFYAGYDDVAKRLRTVEKIKDQDLYEVRKKIWLGSFNMIRANPLKGTGIGTFVWGLPSYRPAGLKVRAHYAHNDYLQLMAEMGIMALPLVLWMLFVTIKEGLTKRTEFTLSEGIALGSAVGLLSLAFHGSVDFNFHITANMLVVAFFAGIIMRRASKRAREQKC